MKKLQRLEKLQLKTILKGFFPGKYISIKKDGRVIIKNNYFSFKKLINSDVMEITISIIPNYLSSFSTNNSLGQYLQQIHSFENEKDIVNYLYSAYISLSHKITKNFTHNLQRDLKAQNFIRVQPVINLRSIFSYFNNNKNTLIIERKQLALNSSTKVSSLQEEILNQKQEFLIKHKYGKIKLNSQREMVKEPIFDNSTIYDGHKEYVQRIII